MMRTPLETAVRLYLNARKTDLRMKTHKYYTVLLEGFIDWGLARNPQIKYLEEAKSKTVGEYLAHLKSKGKAGNTLHGTAQVIKTFLKWCLLDDELGREVSQRELQKTKVPRVHDEEISSFTDEEIEKLIREIEDSGDMEQIARNKAIVYLMLDTGIRASEIALDGQRRNVNERTGLRLEDLVIQDHNDPRIKIMGKGGKPREVPVGNRTAKALRMYINRYRKETNKHSYIFLSRGDNPLTVRGLEQIFSYLSKSSGVHVYPHKFRHTFAVKYLLKTRDIYGLSRLLGHGSVKVTERYLRTLNLREVRSRGSIVDDM
jgi:site-specific recombinase XerD